VPFLYTWLAQPRSDELDVAVQKVFGETRQSVPVVPGHARVFRATPGREAAEFELLRLGLADIARRFPRQFWFTFSLVEREFVDWGPDDAPAVADGGVAQEDS
jgi:hypothetical protein